MKTITLDSDSVIKERNCNSPEFVAQYQKELLINEISKLIVSLRKSA